MRRAAGIVAALALAACQVEVDGAGCREPGGTADCPAGQACGNDGRCSARALACAATRCAPGMTRCAADAAFVEQCSAADPACGAWVQVAPCAERQLVCAVRPGRAAACECPPNASAVFAAGAGGSLEVGELPIPSGLAAPAECRFGRLGDALAAAAARAQATGAPATVSIQAAAGEDVVFGAATGESFPLVVPAGVTLAGAAAPAGASVVRAGGGSSVLAVSGAVQGLRVESEGAVGTGIEISCGSAGPVLLGDVVVDGGHALTRGVSVTGTCGLQATNLHVANVAGTGIYVDAELAVSSIPDVGARIDSGLIEECSGAGAEVRGGVLTLNGVVLRRNGGFGVTARSRADSPKRAIALKLSDCTSEENGEAGLLVREMEAGSSVEVLRSTFRWNEARTLAATEFFGGRRAGGVYLYGTPPDVLVFQGNKVYANANPSAAIVDQLAIVSSVVWDLSGPSPCGALSNVFACPGNGLLVYGHGVKPAVKNAFWPIAPWPPVSLVFNADYDPTCPLDPAPIPACIP